MNNQQGVKMKKYTITYSYESQIVRIGEIEIEANSELEARKIAEQKDRNDELYETAGRDECEYCDFKIESVMEVRQ